MERERLQIQVIRQLDLEDLEVEEVDHSDEDDTDDEPDEEYALFPSQYNSDTSPPPPSSAEFNFDTYIAPSHTYLGDVEDTRHRIAFLDGGAILNLPLFCLRGVVLFPGATLPLRVIEPRLVAAVERALTQDDIPYTIGVTIIAKRSDMLIMSSEGPLSAYVNSGGYVHEIMTLYKANGLALTGSAVADHSWFPGYAWTIATCATCKKQIGWLFTARNKQLKPSSFWGIRSCQLAEEIRQNL
ncbi:hypothetical protein GLYMA_06G087900v4 [Glycine max]|uniref:Protein cereblon n=1 Tax=Glycine max TaxID=3847 RepID=A0A0R0JHV0_SOYBN|nr:hypothetical protein GLYMA_06G087900v4 [Glycine max]